MLSHLFSTAPMLDYSDTHCRYFWRLFTPHALLYTEMIHVNAILHGKKAHFLSYEPQEHPLALQLGGHEPQALAQCAQYAQDEGFDEVNLNVGCPSDRVQSGSFGACLMREPERVAEGVAAMRAKVSIPVTVKTRIGVDQEDSYEFLSQFVSCVAEAGCEVFIIHARKAWLKGLSPKQNRDIPPLNYERVYQLKRDFPKLHFVLNGGIKDWDTAKLALVHLDGIMIGREACANPYFLAELEQQLYHTSLPTRRAILERYLDYIDLKLSNGVHHKKLLKPLMGLFHAQKDARVWRGLLSQPDFSIELFRKFILMNERI
ncbi:MAG: tRNA dihydrouridine(20/20a) synthase DusA [Gammaproteobacteria bacterium]|nr:tRNA dihydrouridine(20/20a) synthase DusA [Gammaproteobacteria bacterium]